MLIACILVDAHAVLILDTEKYNTNIQLFWLYLTFQIVKFEICDGSLEVLLEKGVFNFVGYMQAFTYMIHLPRISGSNSKICYFM